MYTFVLFISIVCRYSIAELIALIEAPDAPVSYQHCLVALNYLVKARLIAAEVKKVDFFTIEMMTM